MKSYIISFVVCLLLCLADNSAFAQSRTHESVDLGLPSGTLWAATNIGAEKPEDFGNYYSWGETETKEYYEIINYKGYIRAHYKTVGGGKDEDGFDIPESNVFIDDEYIFDDNIIGTHQDVARRLWKEDWCLPSKEQIDELYAECDWTRASRNGISGYKITSRTNGKWIFLPAASLIARSSRTYTKGYEGRYWSGVSSKSNPSEAYAISFGNTHHDSEVEKKYVGLTIRPVRKKSYSQPTTRVDNDALYKKSETEAGNSISSDSNNLEDADSTTDFTVVETAADFPGGTSALMEFLSQYLQYPDAAARKGIEGRVQLSFVVEKDGSISDIKEIRSPDESLTIEAIRVLSLAPKWKPATQRGKPVSSRVFLPITFRLSSSNQTK